MYDFSVPNAHPGDCAKCRGSGVYRWAGAMVNGEWRGKEGPCPSCRGTGGRFRLVRRMTKPKLTKDQKAALAAYEFRLREEDRYLGSVFVTPMGQRAIEEKTRVAYERCKALGMTHEHGL